MPTKIDFFDDLSDSLTYWTKVGTSSITDPAADLMWVDNKAPFERLQNALADQGLEEDVKQIFRQCMQGLAHSFLCILDGATKMSENGRAYLVDSRSNMLGEALHEGFMGFLYDQGQVD